MGDISALYRNRNVQGGEGRKVVQLFKMCNVNFILHAQFCF